MPNIDTVPCVGQVTGSFANIHTDKQADDEKKKRRPALNQNTSYHLTSGFGRIVTFLFHDWHALSQSFVLF